MQIDRTFVLSQKAQAADIQLCRMLNGFCRQPWIGIFFTIVSRLGNGVFWYLAGLSLLYIDGLNALPVLVTYIITGLIGVLLYKTLKKTWVRERPFISYTHIFQVCATLDRYSFPSGHTLHAVSFTTILALTYPALGTPLWIFTALIALSRPVLGLHYPSDVLVGAILGLALGLAGYGCLLLMLPLSFS